MSGGEATASREEAENWWSSAREDLRVAKACLALIPPSVGIAAYHCQQAAEKILKGLLILAGKSFRKVHDLDELADLACPLYPEIASELDFCRPLTSWGTDYRYPAADQAPEPPTSVIEATIGMLEALIARTPRQT